MHLRKRCTHTMGGLAPSLHRESTDSDTTSQEVCIPYIHTMCGGFDQSTHYSVYIVPQEAIR